MKNLESHGILILEKGYKMKNNFFAKENGKNVPKMKMISKKMHLDHGKTWRSLGKVIESHGISKAQKSTTEPCVRLLLLFVLLWPKKLWL